MDAVGGAEIAHIDLAEPFRTRFGNPMPSCTGATCTSEPEAARQAA